MARVKLVEKDRVEDAPPEPSGRRPLRPEDRVEDPPPKIGVVEAAVLKGAEGISAGFAPALSGVASAGLNLLGVSPLGEVPVATTREGKPLSPQLKPQSMLEAYRSGRDTAYELQDKAAADRPIISGVAQLTGAIVSPIGKLIPGGRGVVGAGLKAAGEGAAFSAGSSRADLTRGEIAPFLREVGTGALVAGGIGAAGAGIGKTVRKLADKRASELPDRILAEISEGPSGLRTTPTAAKKLVKGADNIVDEVVHGPDADAVRAAYQSRAKDGIKKLQPIVDRVGAKLDESYDKFEKAGAANVDVTAHWTALQQAAQDAAKAGKVTVSKGLQHMADQFEQMAATAGGSIDLRALRQFTTDAQTQAAQAIGGLNEGVVKSLKSALAAEQTKLMASTLAGKATTPELAAALKVIQESNPRMNALLNIRQALELREWKERSTDRILTALKGGAAGTGIVVGAAQGDGDVGEKALRALALGAAGAVGPKALEGIYRAGQRGLTTMGIKAQRAGVNPVVAGRTGESIGRGVASLAAGARARDKKKEKDK
jgi:hypothetical protein